MMKGSLKKIEMTHIVNGLESKDLVQKMNTMRNALIDREEMNYWKNRYSNPQVAKNIWKDVRKDYHKAMKNAIKYLCRCLRLLMWKRFSTVLF